MLNSYGSATITVKIETTYDYYEVSSYKTSHRNQTTTDTIYLHFYDIDDLRQGKAISSNSSIFLSTFNNYYGMEISYETDFGILQSGTLLIYD